MRVWKYVIMLTALLSTQNAWGGDAPHWRQLPKESDSDNIAFAPTVPGMGVKGIVVSADKLLVLLAPPLSDLQEKAAEQLARRRAESPAGRPILFMKVEAAVIRDNKVVDSIDVPLLADTESKYETDDLETVVDDCNLYTWDLLTLKTKFPCEIGGFFLTRKGLDRLFNSDGIFFRYTGSIRAEGESAAKEEFSSGQVLLTKGVKDLIYETLGLEPTSPTPQEPTTPAPLAQ